jgi:aspartate 1-decarboxylase
MQRTMLKSKIHRAKVTGAHLDYEGSISIDPVLLKAANIVPFEQVYVYNIHNGERFSTYAITGVINSGEISLNGAAARKAAIGDLIIVCSYVSVEDLECEGFEARNIYVDGENRIIDDP